jgi:undecaprenyl-diphosphatase
MNAYLLAAVLGVIEGLTEFLPVSSTAHLRIVQSLMGLSLQDEYWKMFSIVIQLGAILSVFVYFKHRILDFLKSFRTSTNKLTHPVSLVMIAFVVTAIPAFLLSKVIGKNLESLRVMGISLLVGGIFMWIIDRSCKNSKTPSVEKMNLKQSVFIGAAQILSAVFPGTSRSMSTIAGGQMVGLSRAASLEFSFFISLPTMCAATAYDLLKTLLHPSDLKLVMNSEQWISLGIGFVVSFVVAYFVIAWFMNWVKTKGFVPFAIYRIALGLFVLFYI